MLNRIKIPEDIISFVEDIQDRVGDKFTVYIGGGMNRDLFCGKTPKDVDIFFVPINGCEDEEVSYIPAGCYVQYNKRTSELNSTGDMKERGVNQVIGLSNKRLSTTSLQFIVYKSSMTMKELAEDFDITICRAVYCVSTKTYYETLEFYNAHDSKTIVCDKTYDSTRMYERYIRMISKFPDYKVFGMPETPEKYKEVVEVEPCMDGTVNLTIDKTQLEVLSSTGSFVGEDKND